jgi:hypothetical protein
VRREVLLEEICSGRVKVKGDREGASEGFYSKNPYQRHIVSCIVSQLLFFIKDSENSEQPTDQ